MYFCSLSAGQVHPNLQAEILFCSGHGVRGEEAGPSRFSLHARGKAAVRTIVFFPVGL